MPKSNISIIHCHDVLYWVVGWAEGDILPALIAEITVTITTSIITAAVISLFYYLLATMLTTIYLIFLLIFTMILLLFNHCVRLFMTPRTVAHQALLSSTISRSLLKFMSIESEMLSNRLILCHPLLLLPSIFPSIRVFSNKSALSINWPKYWSFSFNISPPNEYSGLISFRIDCFDLLAVQGTLKSLLQHDNEIAR